MHFDSLQAIYDHVATFLRTQGRTSQHGAKCAYRGDDGLKCAVGCLIPDDRYDPAMDLNGCSMFNLRNPSESVYLGLRSRQARRALAAALASVGCGPESYALLEALQTVHDGCIHDEITRKFDRNDLETRLKYAAQKLGMTYTPPADVVVE